MALSIHGDRHAPGHPDPLTDRGYIAFDFDNEGGWLDITTNNVDGSGLGMYIHDLSGGGLDLRAEGGNYAELQLGTTDGIATLDGEEGFEITSSGATGGLIDPSGPLTLSSQNAITIKPGFGDPSGGDLISDLSSAGASNFVVNTDRAGNKFTVNDHLGNPIFQLTG